jgi:hypothetical protein
MATAYIHIEDYKSALEHEERAVDIASKVLGDDHPNLQTFRRYLDQIRARVEST